jgi:hypothetical protein
MMAIRTKTIGKSEDLKDFLMVLNLKEHTAEDISPVRTREIFVSNKLIEKSKKK